MDLQFTILSDDEVEQEIDEEEEEQLELKSGVDKSKKNKRKRAIKIDFDEGYANNSFEEVSEEEEVDSGSESEELEATDNIRQMPRMEERIARATKKGKLANKEEETNTGMDAETEATFFDLIVDDTNSTKNTNNTKDSQSTQLQFSQLSLSRSLLRAVERAGYTNPTPVQAQVIPWALQGKDICASAITGSGKTAAFVLPFLERLLFRPRDQPALRVLIITPTRELAQQIYSSIVTLSQFTDISSLLICGGKKDLRSQEAALRRNPDVVVCTPGRMLDHIRNSLSVSLESLDVLVLDEVDRLLDLGFQQEVEELVKHCPHNRQTMLFSATMTPKVEDLVKLSLRRPIRIKSSGAATVSFAPRLTQEFIKVRNEQEIEAILLALVLRTFDKSTIVFFETKVQAHRFCALLQLVAADAGSKEAPREEGDNITSGMIKRSVTASELHGNIPQAQRDLALEKFRQGMVDVLIATDVAARGLDIKGVQTVINAEMPRNSSTYVHRVGRTARAGRTGRSITLVADNRRKVMKEVLKGEAGALSESGQVLSRTVSNPVLQFFTKKISEVEHQIKDFLQAEKIQQKIEVMERDADKAANMLEHEEEISSRPQRTWFQTEEQKQNLKKKMKEIIQEEEQQLTLPTENEPKLKEGLFRTEAEKKAAELALVDDYRLDALDDGKGKKESMHRLSRKKRRRMEVLKEIEQQKDEENEENENKPKLQEKKKGIINSKLALRQKEEAKKERSISEMTMKRVPISRDPDSKSRKKSKVIRQTMAVGGLDNEDWGFAQSGSGKTEGRKKKEEVFTDFDPTKKLRKGGKVGKASFKSKGKFKRRK